MKTIKLVVGLGNPGSGYRRTRHNTGFLVIDQLAKDWGLKFTVSKKCHALIAKTETHLLAQPQTFMNESGQAALALSHYYKYKIKPEDIIIIYDDIDLPLGKIRVRKKGSAGGHKGMQSIIDQLGTQDFPRVRIGIGPKPTKISSEKYVLQKFKKDEWKILQKKVMPKAVKAIEMVLKFGIEKAMNEYN